MRLSSKPLLKLAGEGISKTLSEILVCPVSKQPLRYCKETTSLVSDSIAVSFPIKEGIPCLVPRDGKFKETLKIEVPTSCTLQQLKETLSFGDLVYCSVNPIDFSPSGQPLCLGSSSSVREQARGHRGLVQGPTPHQLMSFPESEIFGFNKLENQDLFVRGRVGVQANDANSQETKPEISPDMLVQGHKFQ
ncbi:hypothetical protein DKX38_021903 [Salix brachista]|uniref:Protein preY, mitochondrial n=1 Tax=Salix brachista TaxID=2182728 RepID=A0A5N5K1I3_9ROSI|nr:hypothetical protein DKX38_021903 [Salix brachista]